MPAFEIQCSKFRQPANSPRHGFDSTWRGRGRVVVIFFKQGALAVLLVNSPLFSAGGVVVSSLCSLK